MPVLPLAEEWEKEFFMNKNRTIAILGQPNCGKSTVFNAITGMKQTTGNWPGVTVERKEGKIKTKSGQTIRIIDLPGVYGLSPITNDERITRDYLLNEDIDLVINIIDGNNMERGLFLNIQLLMLNIPVILVINMQDIWTKKQIELDTKRLTYLLGTKVIPVSGRTKHNIDYLKNEILQFFSTDFELRKSHLSIPIDDKIYSLIKSIRLIIDSNNNFKDKSEFYSLKIIEGNKDIINIIKNNFDKKSIDEILSLANTIGQPTSRTTKTIEWIFSIARGITEEVVGKSEIKRYDWTEIADLFFLNRFISIPIFFGIMFLLFTATYFMGNFFASILENLFIGLNNILTNITGNTFIDAMITEGIIAGVGNVLVLLPYIFIMFILIQLLEDSGYMARVAFIMDRFMHKIGLHGRSFIPIIMGFGCSVPAIMATRTLETKANQLKTMLIIPFIPCSAKLTVIVLLGSALFSKNAPFVIFFLYLISIIIAIFSGFILNKTLIKEKSEGMIMELPDYRMPQIKNLFLRAWMQSKEYLLKAGTLIFLISVIMFILSYFPTNVDGGSINYIGRFLHPIFKPLDFDIPMTISLITGFFAKESIIATLSVLYHTSSVPLSEFVSNSWHTLTGLVYMIFVMIYIPCVATAVIIYKESQSVKWVIFTIIYSILLAYIVSFAFKLILGVFL